VRRALWPVVAVLITSLKLAAVFAREAIDLIRDGGVFSEWDAIGLSLVVVWLAFLAVAAHAAPTQPASL
jgi:hypothetical protein